MLQEIEHEIWISVSLKFVRTNALKPFRFQGNIAYPLHLRLFPSECPTGAVKEETFHHSVFVWKHQSMLTIREEETWKTALLIKELAIKELIKR